MTMHQAQTIRIEPVALLRLIDAAARRVSAFLRLGLDDLDARGNGDFHLSAIVNYQFWPAEITQNQRAEARDEYRAWLTGSCLRELDLFYGVFLDRTWHVIEVIGLHGSPIPAGHTFDEKFAGDPNVARKQERVAQRLGTADCFAELNSLSLARNALAHHAGVVRPRDCNNAERSILEIAWRAMDLVASRNGIEVVVAGMPFDTHTLPGDGPTMFSMQFKPRTVCVPVGGRIALAHSHVAELCAFYRALACDVLEGLKKYCEARGIVPEPNVPQTSATAPGSPPARPPSSL
jgi:hypothetical protein